MKVTSTHFTCDVCETPFDSGGHRIIEYNGDHRTTRRAADLCDSCMEKLPINWQKSQQKRGRKPQEATPVIIVSAGVSEGAGEAGKAASG